MNHYNISSLSIWFYSKTFKVFCKSIYFFQVLRHFNVADKTYKWPHAMRTVVCRFHLYPTVWFSSLYHTVILYDAIMAYPALICTIFTMLCMPGRTSSNLICARSSDFLLYRMFCMQTGRMSGTRRSRLFWLCSVISWYLMSLHVSWCFSPFL